jgi:putative ABC transport system permease protein
MGPSVESLPLARLLLIFIPVLLVVLIQWRWSLSAGTTIYAVVRMLSQLLVIGYVLVFLFRSDSPLVVSAVLLVMITVASWIALRPLGDQRPRLYWVSVAAITVGSLPVLILATQVVININPWYEPRYLIPLAGMIFANTMNSVSIAAERYHAELGTGHEFAQARQHAFQAAMNPLINSLLAVGLVSLPGMMTGQVLSGVSPLIAARYQILVMCMLFGASGIGTVCFLYWTQRFALLLPRPAD